ncbi:MAG: hypothetical protein C3F02_01650 [Parcubacteria group bacterium]|nr:MAG: hypothetical protein C3F02_01650 [Parcubacteria group bacterium]
MILKKIIAFIFQSPYVYQLNQFLWAGDFFPKIIELGQIQATEKTLDIACGTANAARYVRGQYTGIDLNDNYLDYARHQYPRAKFLCLDFNDLKFDEKYFDCTIVTNFIHHLSDTELGQLLYKIRYFTRDRMILSDLLPNQLNFLAKILYNLDQGNNIRTAENQEKIISRYFKIEKKYTFFSPRKIYKHIVFICIPL